MESNFDEVYRATKDDILRFIVIRVRSAGDVEDVFQEVYRSFFVRSQRENAAPVRDARAYLYAAARKELGRYYRKRSIWAEREQPLPDTAASDETPPDERLFTKDAASRVWAVAEQEPILSYKAFAIYYGFSMPVREIATALELTEAAVKQRLQRTRDRVRAACKEQNDDGI